MKLEPGDVPLTEPSVSFVLKVIDLCFGSYDHMPDVSLQHPNARGSCERFIKLAVALTKDTPQSCLVVTEDNLNLQLLPQEIERLVSFVQKEGREIKVVDCLERGIET